MLKFNKVNKAKRWISLLLVAAMSFTLLGTVGASTKPVSDIDGHWAAESLRKWVDNGLLKGYDDGSYKPDRHVTRAEFVSLINRSFKLTEKAELAFADVDKKSWVHEQVSIAVKAGYVNGFSDGSFRPNDKITREQSANMVFKLLGLKVSEGNAVTFTDAANISKSSKDAVATLVKENIINGLPDGSFNPQGFLSRAQSVTLLDAGLAYKVPTTTYDKAGVYGDKSVAETVYGDVVISAPGVTLQNMTIKGDVTVTASVYEGDVHFKKVKIEGETKIQGGGPNSIHFEDSVLVRITVDKKDGSVRVVVAGASSIQQVVVNSSVKLEESGVTDSGFANIQLAKGLPAGSQVDLLGKFENVDILSSDVKVNVPSGTINNLNVQAGAVNNIINLNKDAKVIKLILDAVAKIVGGGSIENATVSKDGAASSFETKPNKVEGSGAVTPTSTPVSNGGGSGGGGPVSTPAPQPTPTATPVPTPVPTPELTPEPTKISPEDCLKNNCLFTELEALEFKNFKLIQLDFMNVKTEKEGFDPKVKSYSIITERNMESITVPITVTKSVYASNVTISLWNVQNEKYKEIAIGNEPVDITINPMEDTIIKIIVRNNYSDLPGEYKIYIQYPRTIQEGTKILKTPSFDPVNKSWKNFYMLIFGTINGEKLTYGTHVVKLYTNRPITECIGSYCSIAEEDIIDGNGKLYIEVYKNNKLFAEGLYEYNTNPVQLLNEDMIIEVDTMDKQELVNYRDKDMFNQYPYSHGFQAYINSKKLLEIMPNVKYIGETIWDIQAPTSEIKLALNQDYVKLRINALGFEYPIMSHDILFLDRIDNKQSERMQLVGKRFTQWNIEGLPKDAHDLVYYVVLYDASYNPIGYFTKVVTFDENHVADGYTATQHWQVKP
ncbi:S-layer homology domain-containing protein [Paenibacillus sp. GSMTC-2017]|uniref:S-layer homology domain-containing protein n=1 Tax=Paenibacillus sp. GSMTC-2017 TaxID=2794350 RepID=UPI0018D735CC|nr:S-layer homology domain-containing protein [Paenibacillus sp. GSMTC-2017]MBH5320507.1 S-layer homology domain-containing protein [Paenibacillus sp. GSMTC-2017]